MRRGRESFLRIGFLDLFLIFLLLFGFLGTFFRWQILHQTNEESEYLEYRMVGVLESTDSLMKQCIHGGDKVYLPSGEKIGNIYSVKSFPSVVHLLSQGNYYEGEWDPSIKNDIRIEIVFWGTEGQKGVFLEDGRSFLAGQKIKLYTKSAALEFHILNIYPSIR